MRAGDWVKIESFLEELGRVTGRSENSVQELKYAEAALPKGRVTC